jgi:hypothetical protein
MLSGSFKHNWDWQEKQYHKVVNVLRENAVYMLNFRLGTAKEDMQECTDMVLEVDGGQIAARLRRYESHTRPNGKKYRDLTIRSYSRGGITELQKLKSGRSPVKWYFYSWLDQQDDLAEWVLIDVPKMLAAGVLNKSRPEIPNKDGSTRFIGIPLAELRSCQAVIRARMLHGDYWIEYELEAAGQYSLVKKLKSA